MRLLDLFCGAGGCSVGYSRAGFDDIVGVDNRPMPRYPFAFVQADAIATLMHLVNGGRIRPDIMKDEPTYSISDFSAIHASPPCQRYSEMSRVLRSNQHPDLVDATRRLLADSGRPWVIENVPGSPLRNPLLLCGTMFKLKVIRHRLFESSIYLQAPGQRCWHPQRGKVGKAGVRNKKPGDWISVAGNVSRAPAAAAMGIAWMTRAEIAQAIPPAYCEWIGKQLLSALES